jgi:Spondin_N
MPKRFLLISTLLPATAVALAFAAPAFGRSYDVTIKDLTDGQPLTPPVVATHTGKHPIFEVGQPASVGVREIAENGNNAPLLAQLDANPFDQISHFKQAGDGPLVPAGKPGSAMFADKVSFTIRANGRANRLSFVSMLVCTNDGFTGIDSVKLPSARGDKVRRTTDGYDAHTEINTEDYADIVPPCQSLIGEDAGENDAGTGVSNPALAEGGVIRHHRGIQGTDDLDPEIHGWTDPVARIKIERMR